MKNELLKAYAEVDKILSCMEDKYVEKIPLKIREIFRNEKIANYNPIIDAKIPLNEQNLERKTFAILAMLNLNYWSEDKEKKQKILLKYTENDKINDRKLKEKFDLDNIFKNKVKNENNNNNEIIISKEENFIKRFLRKFIKFFRKKKNK